MKNTKTPIKKATKSLKKTKITKSVVAYHVARSLVSVAPHDHSGKKLHRRHTSHGALLVAFLLTGILLFSNFGAIRAYGLSSSGGQTISVNVFGEPPTVGAEITYPTTNTTTKSPQIQVTGTCPAETLVATYNNGTFAGSSQCADDGTYATVISLVVGTNILQSQNYDAANQPGPVTGQVTITREEVPVVVNPTDPTTPTIPGTSTGGGSTGSGVAVPETATTPSDIEDDTSPAVTTPAPQPADNPCFDTSKSTNLNPATPNIITKCITRSITAGQTVSLPVRVTGGVKPYTLSINWGDGTIDSKNVLDTEFHNYQHTYQTAGVINVGLKITDTKGTSTFLQTVVQVNDTGTTATTKGSDNPVATITSNISSVLTKAPVPLYFAALVLFLGFWVGDIIERILTRDDKYAKRGRKHPPINMNHHRHA